MMELAREPRPAGSVAPAPKPQGCRQKADRNIVPRIQKALGHRGRGSELLCWPGGLLGGLSEEGAFEQRS